MQQLANHLGEIALTLQVILMAYLTFNFKKYRYAIFGWIALEFLAMSFDGIGREPAIPY